MGLTIIPENIRKCMPVEKRREFNALTSSEAQDKLDGQREKQLQENIAALLRQRGIWFARQRMDKRATSTKGQPDFLFAIHRRPIAFEIKLLGKYLTKEQDVCFQDMEKNGWSCHIIRSEQQAVEALNYLEMTCR